MNPLNNHQLITMLNLKQKLVQAIPIIPSAFEFGRTAATLIGEFRTDLIMTPCAEW